MNIRKPTGAKGIIKERIKYESKYNLIILLLLTTDGKEELDF